METNAQKVKLNLNIYKIVLHNISSTTAAAADVQAVITGFRI